MRVETSEGYGVVAGAPAAVPAVGDFGGRRMSSARIWLLLDSRTVGGVERHVATLAKALQHEGHSPEIVLFKDYGPSPWHEQLSDLGLQYRALDGTFAGLASAIRSEKPALLHTHGYKAGILGRVAGRMSGTPMVSTFHSGERPSWPLNAYYWLDRWSSLGAERIVVTSDIGHRVPYRSALIPNFVDTPPRPSAASLPRRIGFVGRLSQEKAPDWFCELAASSDLDVEWHVYGDGPMRADLEARYGKHVTFHGVVPNMAPVWQKLGLLLIPSRYEGLPFVALEAHAAGVPVAASRVGGLPTVVAQDRTGWLFEAGDLHAAARAMSTWHGLEARAQVAMREACWTSVVQQFATESLLPEIIDVYEKATRSNLRRQLFSRNEEEAR